jgi:uncharacterized protein YndB with AHSA1/START domain
MSRRREIEVWAESTAPPETVFGLLAESRTWPNWSSMDSVALEREGDTSREGVGAIRVNQRRRVTGRDEVLELEPPRLFVYAALSGLPVKDYVGRVELTPTATGTTIVWRSTFFPKVPGTGGMLERGLRKFLAETAEGLAEYASAGATMQHGGIGVDDAR